LSRAIFSPHPLSPSPACYTVIRRCIFWLERGIFYKRGWRSSPQATPLLVNQLPSFVRACPVLDTGRDKRENYVTSSLLLNTPDNVVWCPENGFSFSLSLDGRGKGEGEHGGVVPPRGGDNPFSNWLSFLLSHPDESREPTIFKRGIKGVSFFNGASKRGVNPSSIPSPSQTRNFSSFDDNTV
jgi:hypothetical protein